MAGIADFIVNDKPVEGYGLNVDIDNFSDDVHDSSVGNGAVVYQASFNVSKKTSKTLVLYFPNTWHPNTHGRTSTTNADIANRNIVYGNWKEWWYKTVSSFVTDEKKEMDRAVARLYDEEMKKSRREWNRIARTPNYQKRWKAYNDRIKALREEHRSAKILSEESMPDFWDLAGNKGMSLKEQIEWVKEQRISFAARRRQANEQRSILWKQIRSLSSKASRIEEKKRLMAKYRTDEMKMRVLELENELMSMEAPTSKAEKNKSYELQDKLRTVVDPWSFGFTAESVLKNIGVKLVYDLKNALHGSKEPDIEDKTKQNRLSRGNSDHPPLDETGDFIESLSFTII